MDLQLSTHLHFDSSLFFVCEANGANPLQKEVLDKRVSYMFSVDNAGALVLSHRDSWTLCKQ
jgi:hypothetical protein